MPERGSSHGLIDNFYLSKEELLHDSPSRRAGVDADAEAQLRNFGCQRIQLGVLYLKLPQVVAATGQVLLHRFYCKQSMIDFDVKRVAIAALWLASKLEEAPKKFHHVLMVFARIDSRAEERSPELLDPHSQRFEHLKQDVFRVEKSMLRAFGFVTHVEHPHKFVLSLLQILEVSSLLQEAWNLTNDSLRTTLCVRFKSEVVACGIIFLAARRKQVVLPEGPSGNWWELCSVAHTDVLEVASEIHSLYLQPPPVYVALSRAAQGASAPRVTSLAAAASPASVPASPQGGPPAAGGSAVAGEGSAAMGQVPNGAEASGDGDATGGVGGTSAGRSDSRGQAASGPEHAREAALASNNRPRGRSTSEEAEQPGRRHGSRSDERPRVAEPERSRRGDGPPAAGHEGRRERGRDHSDGRRDGRQAGSRDPERADSRGAAAERTGNGYWEGRREDRGRDGHRDERRHDSRERGREAKRDSRDQLRDRDRAEYEHKRSRPPPPAEPDLGRKRSRLTPPHERSSSRPTLEHFEPEQSGGRTAPEREAEGSGRRAADRLPPLPAAARASSAAQPASNDALPSPPLRPARPGDSRSAQPHSGLADRVPAKERIGHRPSSAGLPPPPEPGQAAPLERNAQETDRSGRGGEPIRFQSRGDGSKGGPQPAAGRVATSGKAQQPGPAPPRRP